MSLEDADELTKCLPCQTTILIDSYAINIRNPFWGPDSRVYRPSRFAKIPPQQVGVYPLVLSIVYVSIRFADAGVCAAEIQLDDVWVWVAQVSWVQCWRQNGARTGIPAVQPIRGLGEAEYEAGE